MSLPYQLSDVSKVVAYKRDQITTDLICLDVITEIAGKVQTWTLHEDLPEFEQAVADLATLPGFLREWRESVVLPPFALCETTLYERPIA